MSEGSELAKRRRWRLWAWIGAGAVALAAAGVVLMFLYWPYRYRKVHPLLESEFHSRVKVTRYYRTYFPHPGFVADGVTFWRNGHTGEPPLATVEHLHVVGTWTGLLFTPHTLYQIWLRGVHVQIVVPGDGEPGGSSSRAASDKGAVGPGVDDGGQSSTAGKKPEPGKLHIETIVANGAVLDVQRHGEAPMHFVFATLQIHNVKAGEPLTFFARARLPMVDATVDANGKVGPLRSGHYAEMPVQGTYSLAGMELARVTHLQGRVEASGSYSGRADRIAVRGNVAIPNFCAGGHVERLDAAYSAMVKVLDGEVDLESAAVKMAGSTITASGTVAGEPKLVRIKAATEDGNLERLLEVVESGTPAVAGKVSFAAAAEFGDGKEPFLKRLQLDGQVKLDDVTFVQSGTQQKVDAFSARVRKQASGDAVKVNASATGETTFRDGVAYFRDVVVKLPGAKAQLHGTFNLLNTRVNMTGTAAMQQSLSRDVGGWKRWLVAPLDPFFRHGKAGAVVPIAVTGTAANPKIGQNLLHDK